MAFIIGLIGEKLSGKDTASAYLVEKYEAIHFRYSQVLDEILSLLNLSISRRNEIDLGMALRHAFGNGILTQSIIHKIKINPNKNIVINGIRFIDELRNVKQLGATIIYITALAEHRYKRYLSRDEKSDDAKHSFDEFLKHELEPTEIDIPALGKQADYTIINNTTLENLKINLDNIIKKATPHV